MVKELKNHKGMWLNDDAAASLERFEKSHGVIGINSAGRTRKEQQALVDRWNRGGTYNRPPYLYPPAPVGTSPHEQGNAIDTSDIAKLANRPEYGFHRPIPNSDPVHFVYSASRDKKKPGAPAVTPKPPTKPVRPNPWSVVKTWPWGGIADMLRRLYGYRGNDVPGPVMMKSFQKFLRNYGYKGKIDGVYGDATAKAHQRWLKARWNYNGLIDAWMGDGTRTAHVRANRANEKAF